jgi:hypothetical protein
MAIIFLGWNWVWDLSSAGLPENLESLNIILKSSQKLVGFSLFFYFIFKFKFIF